MDRSLLEEKIREIIREVLQEENNEKMHRNVDESGVIGVKGSSVKRTVFETGNPSDEVYCTDIISIEESPRLGCGYMEIIENKPFEWTLEYDEVDVILEGVLEIVTETGKIRGEKGDTIYIPKGTKLQFTCPEGGNVRFVYVTYPADWADKK